MDIFLIIFLASCKIQQTDQILDIIPDKETIKKAVKIPKNKVLKKSTNKLNQKKLDLTKYHIGDPYFIEGVEYILLILDLYLFGFYPIEIVSI